jgi:PBP1b-binding outer membrane lipoprotein LpoB
MKAFLALLSLLFLASCANEPGEENAPNPAATKAEVQAREDFASTLPKPRER